MRHGSEPLPSTANQARGSHAAITERPHSDRIATAQQLRRNRMATAQHYCSDHAAYLSAANRTEPWEKK
jgi:hypothetical protein